MSHKAIHKTVTLFIALVWIANGLFCKVLNMVPRHGQIVAAITGSAHARLLTILIGCMEIAMAFWIISSIKTRLNAAAQIIVVTVMNILEFILVPHLLLWGRMNAFFALLFILLVFVNEFCFNSGTPQRA